MNLTELKKRWEKILAAEGMPANIGQIRTMAKIHNGKIAPVIRFNEQMIAKLPLWPDQGDAADLAASPNPTAEAAEADLTCPGPNA